MSTTTKITIDGKRKEGGGSPPPESTALRIKDTHPTINGNRIRIA